MQQRMWKAFRGRKEKTISTLRALGWGVVDYREVPVPRVGCNLPVFMENIFDQNISHQPRADTEKLFSIFEGSIA